MQIKHSAYTLGLDIGIASVGWCALGKEYIIDLGVRTFDKAETADKGESLNLVRRTARLARRRLRRRAWRLKKLVRILKQFGLIEHKNTLCSSNKNLWQLRVEGLDRLFTPEEWARVMYHLCKHRGFHWASLAEEQQAATDSKGEGGKVTQGLKENAKHMETKKYRTAAEMILAEYPTAQRNKNGDYGKALSRVLLGRELTKLFEEQRKLGNPHATAELEKTILGIGDQKTGLFWIQKPALSGTALLNMLGKCTFEKDQFRAPKASFSAERHVWLTRLNNLRLSIGGTLRPLTEQERQLILPLPYQQAGDFTYRQLLNALSKHGLVPPDTRIAGLTYPSEQQKTESKLKDPESVALVKLPGWQTLHKTLAQAGLETEWHSLAGKALSGKPELLDQIAWVLSIYKDDEEVRQKLQTLSLPEAMLPALLKLRFDKFHALSLKT
ncbi:MAG: type II CRISPR RNA-guided endonuclease Cas9, partial [Azovibrio sp.]